MHYKIILGSDNIDGFRRQHYKNFNCVKSDLYKVASIDGDDKMVVCQVKSVKL